MKIILSIVSTLCLLQTIHAFEDHEITRFVPQGKIVAKKKDEVKVQTKNGTYVVLEFNKDGSLEEASGDQIKRDVFTPSQGSLELKDILNILEKRNVLLAGEWSYEVGFFGNAIYQVDTFRNNQEVELSLDAKTGEVRYEEIDD